MRKSFKNIHKYKKLTINDFSQFGWQQIPKTGYGYSTSYNVNTTKSINNGLGISALKMPKFEEYYNDNLTVDTESLSAEKINKVMSLTQYFPDEAVTRYRLLLHCSDNKVYINQMFTNVSNFFWLYNLEFDTPPVCIGYKYLNGDRYLLTSKEKMVVWSTDTGVYNVDNLPIITSMCNYNNVLFCSIADDLYTVWWSVESNPEFIGTETEYAGTFKFDAEGGAIRKVVSFDGNVYVFRDYGISKIYFYSRFDKKFAHIYTSVSKIHTDSIAVCGNEILFMTADGLYSFNGINVNKRNLGIEKYIEFNNKNIVADSLQNKLYIALRLDFKDNQKVLCENESYINNALLVLDLRNDNLEILRGIDIKTMLALRANGIEKMLFTFNTGEVKKIGELDNSGKYFNQELPKYYSTNYLYENDLSKKIIRKIKIIAEPETIVRVITSESNYEFVTTKSGLNEFQTIIPCDSFKIEFNSTDNMKIECLEIEYYEK